MTDIYPYGLLQPDPTTEFGLSWIDNSGEGGDTQTVNFGTDPDNLSSSESDSGEVVPSSDAYVYHTVLDGLEPGTRYHIEIDSTETVTHEFETMPTEMPDRLKLAVTSDHHPWREDGMADVGRGGAVMRSLGRKDYDVLMFVGDWVTHTQNTSSSNAQLWLDWWRYYGLPMDQDKIHPEFPCVGNHEVADGEQTIWNGDPDDWDDEDLDPEAGYFQLFFPNLKNLPPEGKNYGEITVSNYLQLISLDTYSEFPENQTDWLDDVIDESVDHCLPMLHAPMLRAGARGGGEIQQIIREEWAPILHDADNVSVQFSGDQHRRKVTYPYRLVDEEPSHDDYYDIGDGQYLIADEGVEDGIIEFGDGWMNSRSSAPETWYLQPDYSAGSDVNQCQYYTTILSEDYVTVNEWDQWGGRLASHNVVGKPPDKARFRGESTVTISSDSNISVNF